MNPEMKQCDAGHLSFLEIVRVIANIAGPAFASGALLKTGMGIARDSKGLEYPDWESLLAAIEAGEGAVAAFEGRARHYGDGLFGLSACPFANSIASYKSFVGDLPAEYGAVTEQYNKTSAVAENLHVGHGAGVSPFCGVHQPIRSALVDHIRVGGNALSVYQLGCKSASGKRGIATKFLDETGVGRDAVDKVLDENMCCYLVRVKVG